MLRRGLSLGLLLCVCTGCPSPTPLPEAAPVQELIEPRTQRPYLLYVPSIYSDRRPWPVVIACHGTPPYDTAWAQMREWARFGEDNGIIIAVPELHGTRGDFPPPPERQIELQDADEQSILGMVDAVKGRCVVAEEQVFMTGWSAAAYAILHTGLKNPDTFRALFIRQGTFDERFMAVPPDRLSRWQPVRLVYGQTDLLRDQSRACVEWLRTRGLFVEQREMPGAHRRIDPDETWRFFRQVVKERPWIRIRPSRVDPSDPMNLRFELDAIPSVVRQRWFFGDGTGAVDASPTHRYDAPGRYEVTVNVELEGGKRYRRTRVVYVGRLET